MDHSPASLTAIVRAVWGSTDNAQAWPAMAESRPCLSGHSLQPQSSRSWSPRGCLGIGPIGPQELPACLGFGPFGSEVPTLMAMVDPARPEIVFPRTVPPSPADHSGGVSLLQASDHRESCHDQHHSGSVAPQQRCHEGVGDLGKLPQYLRPSRGLSTSSRHNGSEHVER